MSRFKQGFYKLKFPEKYKGDIDKVFYRSSWELKFCHYCDANIKILEWASEEIEIQYIKPTDNRMHRYFPDFYVAYKNTKGQLIREIIEIKPLAQTKPPKKGRRKNMLTEQLTYAVNIAKWQSASKWCKKRGIVFRVMTEKELFR